MTIIGIKEDKGAQNKGAADLAMVGIGTAVATAMLGALKEQAVSLKVYLTRIRELSQPGRTGFRVEVERLRKLARTEIKKLKGGEHYAGWLRTQKSAFARFSEAVTFSKAVDVGYSPDMSESYHVICGKAGAFLASRSEASGPAVRRGRKATPIEDKIAVYLAKAKKDGADMAKVAEIVEALSHEAPAALV